MENFTPKPNYDAMMLSQMKNIPEGTPLLLHACCAPCSSTCLERIRDHFKVTIFFFNPNITDTEEYRLRLDELHRFVKEFKTKYPVDVIDGRYDPQEFFDIAKGLENEPERGARCLKCYRQRLEETRKIAEEYGFGYFTTTLTLSPYKNVYWLNDIGKELEGRYRTEYLYSDFKKKNGYLRSLELSDEYGLYRQDYCGCIFSKLEIEQKRAEGKIK